MLVRAGMMTGKPFMPGVNKEEIMEEGFLGEELRGMVGWDDNIVNWIEYGYIIDTGDIWHS